MINHPTRLAARAALDSTCLAIKPTREQLYHLSVALAAVLTHMAVEPCEVRIGAVVIARQREAA